MPHCASMSYALLGTASPNSYATQVAGSHTCPLVSLQANVLIVQHWRTAWRMPHPTTALNCILHTQISFGSCLWNLYAATSTVYLNSHYYTGCVVSGYFIWQVAGKILTDLLTAEVQINFQSANVHFSTFHSSFPLTTGFGRKYFKAVARTLH